MYLPQALSRDSEIVARQLGYGYRYRNHHSAWYRWGRWVLAGILIFIGLVFLFLILCCSQRRRRRRQLAYQPATPMTNQPPPMNAQNSGYYNQQQYSGGYNQGYAPPAGAPDYGGQQYGVTQPGNTYQPGYK